MNTLCKKGMWIFFLGLLGGLISCGHPKEKEEKVNIHRYEQRIMQIPTDSMGSYLPGLWPEYALYLGEADLTDTLNLLKMETFVKDLLVKDLYGRTQRYYGEGEYLQKQLGTLFAQAKVLFPDFRVPEVYTYISGFDYPNRIWYNDSVLSISLDMYLPEQMELYVSAGLPRYIAQRLDPAFLVVEVARAIAMARVPPLQEVTNLIEEMVYQGKIMCLVDAMLPKVDEKTKLAYTAEQWEWCKANEKPLWHYWMREQLLYETDLRKIKNYVSDGPGNLAFEGAPSRLSQFMGWRIVGSYMRKTDRKGGDIWRASAVEILRVSAYKP